MSTNTYQTYKIWRIVRVREKKKENNQKEKFFFLFFIFAFIFSTGVVCVGVKPQRYD